MYKLIFTSFCRQDTTFSNRAGFRRGGGPQASHQQGASHQSPQFFWLLIDVSLVILIEDFEINENWLNTGRVGYQPIRAQTKRIFKIYQYKTLKQSEAPGLPPAKSGSV